MCFICVFYSYNKHGLVYNVKKSVVLSLRPPVGVSHDPDIRLNEVRFETVSNINTLGTSLSGT